MPEHLCQLLLYPTWKSSLMHVVMQVDICVHCCTAVQLSPSAKDYGLQTIWCVLPRSACVLHRINLFQYYTKLSYTTLILFFVLNTCSCGLRLHQVTHVHATMSSAAIFISVYSKPKSHAPFSARQNYEHMFGCRSRYLHSWFLVDVIACFPLECILFAAAPRVNWYNTPKFLRLAWRLNHLYTKLLFVWNCTDVSLPMWAECLHTCCVFSPSPVQAMCEST